MVNFNSWSRWAAHNATALCSIALVACAPVVNHAEHSSPNPRPLAIDSAARAQGAALATACIGRDGWSDAAPPARIFGNVYYVGTCGISVLLITSPRGHIVIDAATAEAVPSILANIRTLGFDPHDVRYLIGSHEHIDHMGGFAAMKAATGAQIIVREPARRTLETGVIDAEDPQSGILPAMAPVSVDRLIQDGERLTLGGNSLTAIATPGHTIGGTSWTWQACQSGQCVRMVYADSMTAVSADGYRFTDHPARVAPFRTTIARVGALDCSLLITPHPGFSDMFERLSGAESLTDSTACRTFSNAMTARLDRRLAQEAAAQ